jgi:nucleolysin TIA-1/TIAR
MADSTTMAPPQASAPPGYDPQQQQQQQQHMPPPALAPVVIPQNTNPIPTALTSPMSGVQSPGANLTQFMARRAAPEPNKRALYVGGLDPRVTEDVLRQIFETTGHVQNVKIIPDKNVASVSILC